MADLRLRVQNGKTTLDQRPVTLPTAMKILACQSRYAIVVYKYQMHNVYHKINRNHFLSFALQFHNLKYLFVSE